MIDKNFFEKQKFSAATIESYKKSVKRNLGIAKSGPAPEVIFHFAYMALLKIGIYYLAKDGYRAKSRPGHHQKILEYLSRRMGDGQILLIGDRMRKDRNLDLYGEDIILSEKEISEYLRFIEHIYNQI